LGLIIVCTVAVVVVVIVVSIMALCALIYKRRKQSNKRFSNNACRVSQTVL
jgi:heme/copper-type cytochrome/quinol oxidase subunit 2